MSETVTVGGGRTLAALAVAQGRPASEVATVAGVSERTIRRWNQNAGFRKIVSAIREQLIGETLGQLLATNAKAVSTLAALLESGMDQVKLTAASRILELSLRVRNQIENDEAVARIQEQLAELRADQPQLFRKKYDDEN